MSIYLSPAGYYYFKCVHSRSQYFIKKCFTSRFCTLKFAYMYVSLCWLQLNMMNECPREERTGHCWWVVSHLSGLMCQVSRLVTCCHEAVVMSQMSPALLTDTLIMDCLSLCLVISSDLFQSLEKGWFGRYLIFSRLHKIQTHNINTVDIASSRL